MDIEQQINEISALISETLAAMGIEGATVEYEESVTKGHVFNISTRDSQMLIGRQGSHLHSLQVLLQQIVFRKYRGSQPFYFMLDVDDYKRKREWYLRETAKQAVEQSKRIGQSVELEPMPNYERRIVHSYLQEHFPNVSSESIGNEPRRRIVIKVK